MKKICVTGGAGFIASHLIEHLANHYPGTELVVVDKMGYAAREEYLQRHLDSNRVSLVRGSVCNQQLMARIFQDCDLVVHAAAESHVDNSYNDLTPFIENNVEGTISVLKAAVDSNVGMFFHVSTDEVYGEAADRNFCDQDRLKPTNPYSASKASAEMFVNCFASSYGLRTRITRANNIYGTRQYPEKLIPRLICCALRGEKFQVHGTGTAIRSFLHVSDFASSVTRIVDHGADAKVYNVPALREYSVMDVVKMVCKEMDVSVADLIEFGPDRPHNDCRYGVSGAKLRDLGWEPKRRLENDLPEMIEWYRENIALYYDDEAYSNVIRGDWYKREHA